MGRLSVNPDIDAPERVPDNRRFQPANRPGKTGGVYRCGSCGRMTRETGAGESDSELCRFCNAEALTMNVHSDQNHPGAFEDCAECKATMEKYHGYPGGKRKE